MSKDNLSMIRSQAPRPHSHTLYLEIWVLRCQSKLRFFELSGALDSVLKGISQHFSSLYLVAEGNPGRTSPSPLPRERPSKPFLPWWHQQRLNGSPGSPRLPRELAGWGTLCFAAWYLSLLTKQNWVRGLGKHFLTSLGAPIGIKWESHRHVAWGRAFLLHRPAVSYPHLSISVLEKCLLLLWEVLVGWTKQTRTVLKGFWKLSWELQPIEVGQELPVQPKQNDCLLKIEDWNRIQSLLTW